MRGKRKIRQKYLEEAGWHVQSEHKDSSGRHTVHLKRAWKASHYRGEDDPRGDEIEVSASTRPRAFLLAERMLVQKQGRKVSAIRPVERLA